MKTYILIIISMILCTSCTTEGCKNSHTETKPASYRYDCGLMLYPKYSYTCGAGYFAETTKTVCDNETPNN